MELKSHLMLLVFFLSLWIIFPLFFILLNIVYNLPVYRYIFLQIIGLILIILDPLLILYAIGLFRKIGRGTPVPTEPAKKIINTGLYRYARNPLYIAHMFSFLGIFFIFGHSLLLGYVFLSFFGWYIYVTRFEEPKLRKRFGKEYEAYCRMVPRWGVRL